MKKLVIYAGGLAGLFGWQVLSLATKLHGDANG